MVPKSQRTKSIWINCKEIIDKPCRNSWN